MPIESQIERLALSDRLAPADADAGEIVSVRATSPDRVIDPLWYKDAIIYQRHVRAFFDGNGDGEIPLKGILAILAQARSNENSASDEMLLE